MRWRSGGGRELYRGAGRGPPLARRQGMVVLRAGRRFHSLQRNPWPARGLAVGRAGSVPCRRDGQIYESAWRQAFTGCPANS